ncbi:hypothetical protein MMC30_003311 [Trapelia coarctata]|nr:hypothetical protein [Trapelia coarctata]
MIFFLLLLLIATSAHRKAAAAGIDIYGPIPDDYIHKDGSAYHFAEGSNASIWVHAQFDISHKQRVEKRQTPTTGPAHIGISLWTSPGITGLSFWIDDVVYNTPYYSIWPFDFLSVGIAYRSLDYDEQLDLSYGKGDERCGLYLYSPGVMPVQSWTQWDTQPVTCFRLWVNLGAPVWRTWFLDGVRG